MGLKEAALFPTAINKKEREELYQLLEKSSLESIPFAHLRSDMEPREIDYLIKRYHTEVFNIHTQRENPLIYDYSKYKNIIYIENVYYPLNEQGLKNFGGICLDFSHLETDRLLHKETFKQNVKMLENYPIGCNHISAIKRETHLDEMGKVRYDDHHLKNLSELDYLKKYPLKYFALFVAVELENSIKEQLAARDYIIDLIELKKKAKNGII